MISNELSPSPHSADRSRVGMIERSSLPDDSHKRGYRSKDYHMALVQKVISDADAYCAITPGTLEQTQAAHQIEHNRQTIHGYKDEISNRVAMLNEVEQLIQQNGVGKKELKVVSPPALQSSFNGALQNKTTINTPYEQGKLTSINARQPGLPPRYTKSTTMKM